MSDNKLMAMGTAGLILGASPWYFLQEIGGHEIQEPFRSAIVAALAPVAAFVFYAVSRKEPGLAAAFNSSGLGAGIALFLYGLVTAGAATLLAFVHSWLEVAHWVWVLPLGLAYLVIAYRMLDETMKRDKQGKT
jgi:hypothetical protein